jgi:hypothetical protein
MYKSAISSIGSSLVVVLFLYSSLTIEEEYNYKNNLLNYVEIFAQEENNIPVVKNLQIIEFNGINYTDIVNSQDFNPNSFTVSVWFNTAMNVTAEIDNAILLNRGGFGSDRPGSNLNYGIWLNNREKVTGGFETSNGDDYFVTSQGSYADGLWHNAILTFDDLSNLLKLYIDGVEAATNTPDIGTTPDITGKQLIRLGANSLVEKGRINGNYTGQLDDIKVWDYAFTKEQVTSLFDTESRISR